MNKCILVNKMSHLVLMTSCLLLSAINQASASEASHCEASGSTTAERNAQIHACLAQASSPANVKGLALQYKKQTCMQNAKNKALKGTIKEIYLETCINKNEAEETFAALTGL